MTIIWNSNINIDSNLQQTPCGTLYGFSSSIGANIAIPEILSTSITEIEWIIPFTYKLNSSRTQNLCQRANDYYLPYFPANSSYAHFFDGSSGYVASPSLAFNVKYWLKVIRNYSTRAVAYAWSTDGVTYTTYMTRTFANTTISSSNPYILGNNGGGTEAWDGNIFLSEVKCKVDGVNIPLYTNSSLNWNNGISFTGDVIVSQEGCVSGFKPDTHIELAMPEITGANPSSTLTYIIPIIRTSQCPTNREAQMGWKAERWVIPKFINNSNNALYAYNNTTGRNVQVSPALTLYQKYWIKIDWTEGTGTRTYSYSTDGENFTQYTSFNDTSMASATPSGVTFLGMGNANSSETAQWFNGDIYLADMKIIADGVEIPTTKTPTQITKNIFIGSGQASKIYLGNTEVDKIYLGDTLVYDGTSN